MKYVILNFVLATVIISGCKQKATDTYASEKKTIPCWYQNWRDGVWKSLDEFPKHRDYIVAQPVVYQNPDEANDVFYISICENTGRMRIIDPNRSIYRLIISPYEQHHKGISDDWVAGLSTWSYDPIKEGDLMIMYYKNQFYIIKLLSILDDDTIKYEIAQFASESPRFSLENLKFEHKKATESFTLKDRPINFSASEIIDQNSLMIVEKIVSIEYDYGYGYYGSPTTYPKDREAVHIAIIHKKQYENSAVIDITKYRFKTWEDGLGNLCDSNIPK